MGRRCSVVLAWTIVVSALVGGTPLARAADFPGRAKVEPALLADLAQGG